MKSGQDQYVKKGYRIAVELDIRKFFDEVDHDILMPLAAPRARDKTVLNLIGRYLRAGVAIPESEIRPPFVGTPQGRPLPPLLATILLDVLDKELERRDVWGREFPTWPIKYASTDPRRSGPKHVSIASLEWTHQRTLKGLSI